MKGFLLGLVAASLAFAGYLYVKSTQAPRTTGLVASVRDAGAPTKKKRKRARGATRVARAGAPTDRGDVNAQPIAEAEPEPEPVRLSAADLRTVGQGDDLSRPDVIKMDLGDNSEARELTQDDIDARFRGEESAILECIMSARPDQDTYVPGRVTVKFRIQRAGTVRGVRVEAPAILQKGGLYGCIKKVVGGIRFPASGGSQIVTYPFTLS
jgi:hypothetical protein